MKILKKIDYGIRYSLAVVFRLIYRTFVILYQDVTPYEEETLYCFKCGKPVKFIKPVLEINRIKDAAAFCPGCCGLTELQQAMSVAAMKNEDSQL